MGRKTFIAWITTGKPRAVGLDINVIIARIAEETGIQAERITGHERIRAVAHARQAVMLACHRAGHSKAAIGRALNRDHTTVMHGIKVAMARGG